MVVDEAHPRCSITRDMAALVGGAWVAQGAGQNGDVAARAGSVFARRWRIIYIQ